MALWVMYFITLFSPIFLLFLLQSSDPHILHSASVTNMMWHSHSCNKVRPSTTNIQSMWQIPSWGPSALVFLLSVAILHVVPCVRIHGARPTLVSKTYQGADCLVCTSVHSPYKIWWPGGKKIKKHTKSIEISAVFAYTIINRENIGVSKNSVISWVKSVFTVKRSIDHKAISVCWVTVLSFLSIFPLIASSVSSCFLPPVFFL